jgi:hypothetical protein
MFACARAVLLGVLVPAAAAVGQLVTQPPEHVLGPEDRIAKVVVERPRVLIDPPSPAMRTPFKTLVHRDADGKLIPLREPIEWAALRNNPLITPDEMSRIGPVLEERRRTIDRIVIDNLDVAEQIDGGFFEKIDLANNQAFQQLLNVSKPLRPDDLLPMSRALMSRGLLTYDQESLNNKIAQEYKLAAIPSLGPDAGPEQRAGHARRSLALLYKEGLDEPLFELRRMRLAAASLVTKKLPLLGLDATTAAAVTGLAGRMHADDDEKTTLDLLGQINARMTLEQRKLLLRIGAERP